MLHGSISPGSNRSRAAARVLAALLLLAPLLVLGVSSLAAPAARRVENPHGDFREDCGMCHRADAWTPVKVSRRFDHGARYGFPLEGAHAAANCTACHATLEFKQHKMNCTSCHEDIHRGENGTDCARCHSARSFTDMAAMRRLHQTTRFPLTGGHAGLDCETCHKPAASGHMQFVGTRAACADCHMADFRAAKDPDHGQGFSTDCASCHTPLGWHAAKFDHSQSGFPLTGAHRAVACGSCHANNQFKGTPKDCVSCHRAQYDATTTPAHGAAGFPVACATCHSTTAWNTATFDHNATAFPLTGAHRATTCAGCHGDGVYNGKSTACASCHQTDYNGATSPRHTQPSFPLTCTTCHGTTSWSGAAINHDATAFPLTGAHRATACTACHGDGVYQGKTTLCYGCHQADYSGTTDPRHTTPSFPTTCTPCHTTTSWAGATFNHAATAFPLTGAHIAATCVSCHGDGVYAGKSTACVSCHQTDYNNTTDPHHTLPSYPTTCTNCHGTASWAGAAFDHSTTAFPLTGAHRSVNCAGCHGDGVYAGKSTDCYSCHAADYNGVTNPRHSLPSFPTSCTSCHTTTSWAGASFNHANTAFPLTGAHTTASCGACHGDGVYAGKSTACVSCHQTDYNTAVDPNHPGAGIATTCGDCHTTTLWAGARVNHDSPYFKIYSGKHNGKWTNCSDCHNAPTNYAQFDCLSCHPKTRMDSEHAGRSGYSYQSSACYSCHRSV